MDSSGMRNFDPRSIKGFNPSSLKSLTLDDIKNIFKSHQVEAFSVLFIIGAVIGAIHIHTVNSSKAGDLEIKLSTLMQKEDPVKKYKKILQEKNTLLETIPGGLDDSEFIPAITDIAKRNNIRITDFSPPVSTESSYYKVTSSRLDCNAKDFRSLMRFINALESAAFSMKVETWQTSNAASDKNSEFNLTISISSIKVNADISKVKESKS